MNEQFTKSPRRSQFTGVRATVTLGMRSADGHHRDISGHVTAGTGCGVGGRGWEGGKVEKWNGDAGGIVRKLGAAKGGGHGYMSQIRVCLLVTIA